MAKVKKRMTDTGKWTRWFRKAPAHVKLMWLYLLDSCEYTGIWKVELDQAEFAIGEPINVDEFLSIVNAEEDRVVQLSDKWWFLPGFIPFQTGSLHQTEGGKKSYLKENILNGLYNFQERTGLDISEYIEQYLQPAVKKIVKKKKKADVTPKDKPVGKTAYGENVHMSEKEYGLLIEKYGKVQTQKLIDKLDFYKGANGKSYKSDYKAILSWVIDSVGVKPVNRPVQENKSEWYHKVMAMAESSRPVYAKYLPESEQEEIYGKVLHPREA